MPHVKNLIPKRVIERLKLAMYQVKAVLGVAGHLLEVGVEYLHCGVQLKELLALRVLELDTPPLHLLVIGLDLRLKVLQLTQRVLFYSR